MEPEQIWELVQTAMKIVFGEADYKEVAKNYTCEERIVLATLVGYFYAIYTKYYELSLKYEKCLRELEKARRPYREGQERARGTLEAG